VATTALIVTWVATLGVAFTIGSLVGRAKAMVEVSHLMKRAGLLKEFKTLVEMSAERILAQMTKDERDVGRK